MAAGGGLSVSPGIVEHVASRGGVGALKISNTSSAPVSVRVAARPWLQSRGGEVSPNRRRTLREVRFDARSFTLAANVTRTVNVSLRGGPARRSLYGGIEVTGVPLRRITSGIKLAYRLVSSLRLDPPRGAQVFRARGGGLVEQGGVRHGTLLLAVRNTGNTIAPIGGTVRISGSGRSLRSNATPKAIVPGATVNLPLAQLLGSLSRGRYTVSVALSQDGHALGTVRRRISLR